MTDPIEAIPKPDELLALHDVTEDLFGILRRWFDVPASVPLDLADIDSAVVELGDPEMIAALAMRKLQALRLLATPGVRTTTDVVVAIVNDLDRALLAGTRLEAATSGGGDGLGRGARAAQHRRGGGRRRRGRHGEAFDEEVALFRTLHQQLHEAAIAVVEASQGEIRIFE